MGTTTLSLIESVKLRGSFPTANNLFSNSSYLQILNDEMMNQVVPLIQKLNADFFLAQSDSQVSANVNKYRINKRAIGSLLRDIQIVDAAGNSRGLPRLQEEDRLSDTQGDFGYYIQSNQIILSPMPVNSQYSLRQIYFRRPSKFVLPTACAQITSIDTGNNQVVVSSVPSAINNGIEIDFVQNNSPYDLLAQDYIVSGISGTTISFSSLPSDLAVGDYICLAGETCVPMVPEELVPFLVQSALCVCLSSKKDKSVELELQKLEMMKQSLVDMMAPRVKSSDVKIKNRNSILNHFRG